MNLWIELLLGALALFTVVSTIMPLIHTDHWWIRGFDFPRVQVVVIMAIVLLGYALAALIGWWAPRNLIPIAAILAAGGWQAYRILPYTPIWPEKVAKADQTTSAPGRDSHIRLLISNVRFDNRDAAALHGLIETQNPDVVFMVEPTDWWDRQMAQLAESYPYHVRQPQENHYGMLLYSRYELVKTEMRHLVEDDVPSLRTGVKLPNGQVITIYGMHPKPPGLYRPQYETEREDSDERDAELLMVAEEIDAAEHQPTLVVGDFNDVAWSHTTRLLQRVGGLLDPRIGRGLFNTYSTQSYLMCFPLDHVFCTEHFRLVEIRRLPSIGSDHYPMLAELTCEPIKATEHQEPPHAVDDDLEEAEEVIHRRV